MKKMKSHKMRNHKNNNRIKCKKKIKRIQLHEEGEEVEAEDGVEGVVEAAEGVGEPNPKQKISKNRRITLKLKKIIHL